MIAKTTPRPVWSFNVFFVYTNCVVLVNFKPFANSKPNLEVKLEREKAPLLMKFEFCWLLDTENKKSNLSFAPDIVNELFNALLGCKNIS